MQSNDTTKLNSEGKESNFNGNLKKQIALVVDDDKFIVKLIQKILSISNIETISAENGIEAIKLVETQQVDIVLMDVMMPYLDGFEACKRILSILNDIPIIFLTSLTNAENIVNGFSCGAVDYIKKPFIGEELLVRVKNQLELRANKALLVEKNNKLELEIKERERAQLALKEEEIKFKAIIENSGDIIWETDSKFKTTYVSPRINELLGLSIDSLIGEDIPFLYSVNSERIEDEKFELRQAIAQYGKLNGLISKILNTENSRKIFETNVSAKYSSLRDVIGYFGVSRDITLKYEAEKELHLSEEKNRLIIEGAQDIIYMLDADKHIVTLNKVFEKLTGFNSSEFIGKHVDELIHPDDIAFAKDIYSKIFENAPVRDYDLRIIKNGGGHFICEFSISPLIKDGVVVGAIGIARDISERKRVDDDKERLIEELRESREVIVRDAMDLVNINDRLAQSEDKLKELNAQKDKFFSIISHDMRNLLAGLLSSFDISISYFDRMTDSERLTTLEKSKQVAENLFKLLENLLQWSKIQRGAISFTPQKAPLKESVNKVIDVIMPNANAKHISIKNNITNAYGIIADLNMFDSIVRNLLTNAIKFTNRGGEIIISAAPSDNEFIAISVSDNGVGMDRETSNRIFRIDANHTTLGTENEKGTGLGLALCREFVEKHNGVINVESEIKKGTTFTFTLPFFKDNIKNNEDIEVAEKSDFKHNTMPVWLKEIQENYDYEDINNLINRLSGEFIEKIENLKKTQIISRIENFSYELIELGSSFNSKPLKKYGELLKNKCSSFSIDEINNLLNEFDYLIEYFKTQEHGNTENS